MIGYNSNMQVSKIAPTASHLNTKAVSSHKQQPNLSRESLSDMHKPSEVVKQTESFAEAIANELTIAVKAAVLSYMCNLMGLDSIK